MESNAETIAAIATPSGFGGVGIVRVSGSKAFSIASQITQIQCKNRYAHYCSFKRDQTELIDQGIAIFFKGPYSYTGEDVLELQGHGGPVVLDSLLNYVISLGCRIARPGEFTERAFLNGKLDLTQAEAVSDLIEATSEQAVKASLQSMQGYFSQQTKSLTKQLIELRVYIESALDFAEEEIDFLKSEELSTRIELLNKAFLTIQKQAKQGKLLKEGIKVVITGKPNVGKSSLLNSLTGQESAIVTSVAGTTRDVLTEQIIIDGLPVHIIDTAGIRESDDIVEIEGIKRAYKAVEDADRVIVLSTIDEPVLTRPNWVNDALPVDYVINKIDDKNLLSKVEENDLGTVIYLSAKTGEGLSLFKRYLKKSVGYDTSTEGTFITRRRHLTSINTAQEHVLTATKHLEVSGSGELAAQELYYAQQSLNEITGEFTSDDLLGEIFSSFCIGK